MGTGQPPAGLGKPANDRKRRDQKPRVIQSCSLCRQRKLKCNRKLPCDNCVKRKEDTSCRYATKLADAVRNADRGTHPPDRIHHLEERIKQLEKFIASQANPTAGLGNHVFNTEGLMQGHQRTNQTNHANGLLLSGPGGTRYINSAHWQSIRDATKALKGGSSHTNNGTNDETPRTSHGSYLLTGLSGQMSMNDLLAALPSRETVESLVATYLNSREPSQCFVHRLNFISECNEMWNNPTKVPPAWLACLYGMMSFAVWIDHITKNAISEVKPELPETFDFYRKSCALCLASSDYTIPGHYKVEALGIYLGVEILSSSTPKTSVSVLLGISIRLAIIMGYHQDAQLYSNISVFEAEMRRRTWLFLQVADCMVSCLIGVPRVITGKLGDTEFPRDILDEDFGPTTVELPPSQSISKRPTSITYMVALRRIMTVYNEMMDTITSKKLTYDETLQLNHDLEVARDHIPPLLRMHALDYNCPKADNDIIIERHMLEITFQRARCILHRQYLLSNRGESMNRDLRRTCAHAAQRIIELQIKLFQEIIPRARQYRRTWLGASMCITDCLTAAMIICFEIINLSQAEKESHSKIIAGLIELLRNLYNTWKVAPEPSFETSQAADTLAAMFKLVQSGDANITLHSSGPVLPNDQDGQAPPGSLSGSADGRVEMQDPLTLGCLQDLLNTDWAFEMFDWGLWDHEMQELSGIISNNMSA